MTTRTESTECGFTPGPWETNLVRHEYEILHSSDREHVVIALVCGRAFSPTVKANARLIAASPRMFALIERVAAAFEDTDSLLGIEARAIMEAVHAQP